MSTDLLQSIGLAVLAITAVIQSLTIRSLTKTMRRYQDTLRTITAESMARTLRLQWDDPPMPT